MMGAGIKPGLSFSTFILEIIFMPLDDLTFYQVRQYIFQLFKIYGCR